MAEGKLKVSFDANVLLKLLGLSHYSVVSVERRKSESSFGQIFIDFEIEGVLPEWAHDGDVANYLIRGECPTPELVPDGREGLEHYADQLKAWADMDREWKAQHAESEGESAGT